MTQLQPAPTAQPMNRQQRRRAERTARKGKGRKGKPSGPVSPALQQAAQHHQAGRLEEAERFYRQALKATPDDATALHFLGGLLNQTGRNEEALPLLQKAAALTPENPEILNNLGAVYVGLGQPEKAVSLYEKAIGLRPDYADAHRNLGFICLQQNRFGKARSHLEKALSSYVEDPVVFAQLADACGALNDWERAADYYIRALNLKPGDSNLMQRIGLTLTAAKRYSEALSYLTKAIPCNPNSRELQRSLELVLRVAPPDRHLPELESALIVCFDSPFLAFRRIAGIATQQVRLKYHQEARIEREESTEAQGSSGSTTLHMDGLLADQLLLRLLRKTINIDLGFELFLTAIRRALLFSACQQPAISPPAMAFMAALASQCHHNCYVFFAGSDESHEVNRLVGEIGELLKCGDEPGTDLETKLALVAMYQPLSRLPQREVLERIPRQAWSEEIKPLIQLALLHRLEEARISTQIQAIVEIEDDTSRAVQSQYEENPYPRWIGLPEMEPCSFTDLMREQFPEFAPPAFLQDEIEVLVAGCGTGQHPISVALLLRNAHVTAIDLSRASLAYATRMARQLSVDNVEFYQGDILGLSALGRQFPVIESSGVLHHMRNPDAGLASLTGLLRPGGMLKLGLYSELARQGVVAARARIAELGLAPSEDSIRAFRRAVLSGQELPGSNIARFGDFYDLDSCRDLVFHVQEHRFTIPQLRAFLDRQSLRFIGFFFSEGDHVTRFREMFSDPAAAYDLDCWQQFEEANPATFAGMYQFWCQKPL